MSGAESVPNKSQPTSRSQGLCGLSCSCGARTAAIPIQEKVGRNVSPRCIANYRSPQLSGKILLVFLVPLDEIEQV